MQFRNASDARVYYQIYNKDWLDSPWSGFFEGKDPLKVADTGCQEETLTHIGKRYFEYDHILVRFYVFLDLPKDPQMLQISKSTQP